VSEHERKRSVNVEGLTDEQLESVIAQISDKILAMVNETCDKSNKLLNVYGLEAKMEIKIQRKDA